MTSGSANLPLVSVIVACRNAARTLPRCLESIWSQRYPRLEILVVDGASSDGTAAILAAASPRLALCVSEPDRGICDAWNKALGKARGEWVAFLGADDWYGADTSLSAQVELARSGNFDLVTTQALLVRPAPEPPLLIGERWDWDAMRRYQRVIHVGALHRRSLFDRYGPFDAGLRIVGDYDFLLRLPREAAVGFLARPTVSMSDGGISRSNLRAVFMETFAVQCRHEGIGPLRATRNLAVKTAKRFARSVLC